MLPYLECWYSYIMGSSLRLLTMTSRKFSIIPSVIVVCDIPESTDEPFYRSQVLVEDSALEASSPLRHCTT